MLAILHVSLLLIAIPDRPILVLILKLPILNLLILVLTLRILKRSLFVLKLLILQGAILSLLDLPLPILQRTVSILTVPVLQRSFRALLILALSIARLTLNGLSLLPSALLIFELLTLAFLPTAFPSLAAALAAILVLSFGPQKFGRFNSDLVFGPLIDGQIVDADVVRRICDVDFVGEAIAHPHALRTDNPHPDNTFPGREVHRRPLRHLFGFAPLLLPLPVLPLLALCNLGIGRVPQPECNEQANQSGAADAE